MPAADRGVRKLSPSLGGVDVVNRRNCSWLGCGSEEWGNLYLSAPWSIACNSGCTLTECGQKDLAIERGLCGRAPPAVRPVDAAVSAEEWSGVVAG
jgi:hypothetical protein